MSEVQGPDDAGAAGGMEEVVYPLTGRYPWICAFCKRRSVIRMRMPRRDALIETNRGMWGSRYRT